MLIASRSILVAALLLGLPAAARAQEEASVQKDEQLAIDLDEAAAKEAAGEVSKEAGQSKPATVSGAANFSLPPSARPEDVKSLDAIVAALYDVISGDADQKRDWNRFRSLFYPGARMIPTGPGRSSGKFGALIGSPADYIKANEAFIEQGFHQLELSRHVDSFGPVSQVFSYYEARRNKGDAEPFLRGVNSIQLLNDGSRWWVLSLAWTPETPGNPLPKEVFKKVER